MSTQYIYIHVSILLLLPTKLATRVINATISGDYCKPFIYHHTGYISCLLSSLCTSPFVVRPSKLDNTLCTHETMLNIVYTHVQLLTYFHSVCKCKYFVLVHIIRMSSRKCGRTSWLWTCPTSNTMTLSEYWILSIGTYMYMYIPACSIIISAYLVLLVRTYMCICSRWWMLLCFHSCV